jgi:cytoskeleton protein RodZ
METLGQELRKEREKRNISLKEVVDGTRISRRYLDALEEDNLGILPGAFFIKGIVRGYAKAIGLDGDLWIERYRRAGLIGGEEASAEGSRGQAPRISRNAKRSLAGAAAVLLAVASFGLYYLTRSPKRAEVPENRMASVPPQVEPQASPAPVTTEPAPPVKAEEETGLRIQITFIAETWIQVYSDGKPALDGIKLAGARAEIRAETELLINLGNAGGLEYTLNGKPGKSFGKSGAVIKNIRITPGNIAEFTAAEGTR